MDNFAGMLDGWQIKLALSTLFALFYPFKFSLIILAIVITLDTVIGICYAIKIKKFKIRKINKYIVKMITYFVAIASVRLLEGSIEDIYTTTAITQLMASFLTLSEVLSILKNLALLDVPIPSGFIKVIFSNIKNKALKRVLSESLVEQGYKDDINDIIEYQIPTISSKDMQVLLKIKCEEWSKTIDVINGYFSNNSPIDNDLIYYKILSILNSTIYLIDQEWAESGIPEVCIKNINTWHSEKSVKFLDEIKEICYSSDIIENKKKQIITRIIIGLYQTILDIKKGEKELLEKK